MKHIYRGTTYQLIANEFTVEAETYQEAKNKLEMYEADFGGAEDAGDWIIINSIGDITDD